MAMADPIALMLFALAAAIPIVAIPVLVARSRHRLGGNPASSLRRYWFPWSDFDRRERLIATGLEVLFLVLVGIAVMRGD